MANRGQKGNREKRKPKAETVKSAPVTSRLILMIGSQLSKEWFAEQRVSTLEFGARTRPEALRPLKSATKG